MAAGPTRQQLRIGTRASPMARAMANNVMKSINKIAPSCEISILTFDAEGDRIQGSLQEHGGKGTFIKDLELRLLNNEVDCAIHSLKDIPGDLPPHPDLVLVSYLRREDPRDALILREGFSEATLLEGGVIGSSAPRRQAALKKLYPKAEVKLCRGNVNTRLQKLDNKEYDGIILSNAGLRRLNLETRVTRVFGSVEVLPAIGQGIVAIQVRKSDMNKYLHLKMINDFKAETAAKVERAMLFRLQGNCHSAIAGHCAFLSETNVQLSGIVYNTTTGDYLRSIRQAEISSNVEALGTLVADDLIAQGAHSLMAA